MSIDQSEKTTRERVGRTFDLDPGDLSEAIPEAVEATGSVSELTSNRRKPSGTAKTALVSVLALGASLLLYDMVSSVVSAWMVHPLLGGALGLLFSTLSVVAVVSLYRWIWGGQQLQSLYNVQAAISDAQPEQLKRLGPTLIQNLQRFYQSTAKEEAFNEALATMPDYLNGEEQLRHIERVFIDRIDHEVEARIRQHSVQTGISVAASPLPALDVLLTLWRNLKLIAEISELYGIQPGFTHRIRILYRVLNHLAYVGLTEVALDRFDLLDLPFLKTGGRLVQGLGSAVATVRIGLEAQRVCRPVPIKSSEKGMMKELVKTVTLLLGKRWTQS